VPRGTIDKRIAVVAAALAAILLCWGALVTSWWTGGGGATRFAVGLHSVELCTGGACRAARLPSLGGGPGWPRIGMAALASALLAAGVLVVVAVLAALGRMHRAAWPARVAATSCVFCAVLGAVFALIAPVDAQDLVPGYGMALFFAGTVVGAATGALVLSVASRPSAG
jgi:hypothetical protein